VTSIGDYAFYKCTSLTSIILPQSIKSVSYNTFYNCNNLKYNIYNGVKYLGTSDNAYFFLMHHADITNTSYEVNSNTKIIAKSAFASNTYLKEIIIPEGITSIFANAFYGCTALEEIKFPNSVTTIGEFACYNCAKLTEVTLGSGLTQVGNSAFYGCKITSVYWSGNLADWCKINFLNSQSNPLWGGKARLYLIDEGSPTLIDYLEIPQDVVEIKNYAFYGGRFSTVEISNGVTTIGDYAFASNSILAGLIIGKKVKSIYERAFSNCTALSYIRFNAEAMDDPYISNAIFERAGREVATGAKIIIGSAVKKIPANLFSLGLPLWEGADYHAQYDNDLFANFTSIEFESNSNCTTIGANAFAGCHITKLYLPDSVNTANDYAFSGCKQLKELSAPGLTTIGTIDTFYNCPLENILVTSSVIKALPFLQVL
jgi:hypothetical protein